MGSKVRLGHVGVFAQDPVRLAGFYVEFLGLQQTARIETDEAGQMVMLSSRPQETFQELALVANPQARHVAFQVETLADLQELYARALAQQVTVIFSLDHGTQLSFYFLDPEGNPCEAFWETGKRRDGGNRPIDLGKPEEELLELIGT